MRKLLMGCLLALTLAPCARAVAPQSLERQPRLEAFTINHRLRANSSADLRFLLSAPAGKEGFIHVAGGHLVTPDGRRFRIWGVNVTGWTPGSALLPSKQDAKIYARTLAQLGVNCVRFQFLDLTKQQHRAGRGDPVTYTPGGLLDGHAATSQIMDPGQLDRLDYLVYQLKKDGIYVDFNLNVGRHYKSGDGVRDYKLIGAAKAITEFDPHLIRLQKNYARQLLTHYNPYTRTKYSDEPAVAIVEIVNENSLLEFWQRNWLRGKLVPGAPRFQLDLPPYYKAMLTRQYNGWLKATYSPAMLGRLRKLAGLGAGQRFSITQRQDFDSTPMPVFDAEADFFTHVERAFLQNMRAYLKQKLHVKSLIMGTADHTYFIPGMPLLRANSKMDIVGAHGYWQHPAITVHRNTPMVDDPLHSLPVMLSRSTMVHKPFIVSEVNEPFPNDYEAELIPVLAAYGAFQDWDGIFIYSFEPKVTGSWRPVIGDHFDISEDPVKIAEMPVGALLFLRHDVAAAKHIVERTYSTEQVDESMRLPQSFMPYFTPGFPLFLPLEHGSRIRCLDCQPTRSLHDEPSNPFRSDTGQLAWWHSGAKGGLVTIDTPGTTALVGFVSAYGIGTSHLSADVKNKFCSITLSSLNAKPLSTSSLMLLTATGRVQNTGSVWNAGHTNFTVWGKAPTRIQVIRGWVKLKGIVGAVGMIVTPLDGESRALGELRGKMVETGWEIRIGVQPATSYLIRVIR